VVIRLVKFKIADYEASMSCCKSLTILVIDQDMTDETRQRLRARGASWAAAHPVSQPLFLLTHRATGSCFNKRLRRSNNYRMEIRCGSASKGKEARKAFVAKQSGTTAICVRHEKAALSSG
jgi:hypothetical protein